MKKLNRVNFYAVIFGLISLGVLFLLAINSPEVKRGHWVIYVLAFIVAVNIGIVFRGAKKE